MKENTSRPEMYTILRTYNKPNAKTHLRTFCTITFQLEWSNSRTQCLNNDADDDFYECVCMLTIKAKIDLIFQNFTHNFPSKRKSY